MGKPVSSISDTLSVRLPKELIVAIGQYAIANGILNDEGRTDRRGTPNYSRTIIELCQSALGLHDSARLVDNTLHDSVRQLANRLSALEAIDTQRMQDYKALSAYLARHDQELQELRQALENTRSEATVSQNFTSPLLQSEEGSAENVDNPQINYDRESLEKMKLAELRKLYTAVIPFQHRSIVTNKLTKPQAITAILEYQAKKADD